MPGNTFLPAAATRLSRDSVVNITALVTLNKTDLNDRVGRAPEFFFVTSSEGYVEFWACNAVS